MGNNNSNKYQRNNKKDIINKSFTLCPLIKNRNLIIDKKIISNFVNCIGIIHYNNNDFIIVGFEYAKIEIYDSKTLEKVANDNDEIKINEYIRYVSQLSKYDFIVVSQTYIRIYAFYLDEFCSEFSEGRYYYDIKLLQKFDYSSIKKIFKKKAQFSKGFIFDRNLYKEYDIYEKEKERRNKIKKNNYNRTDDYFKEDELIIGSNKGIFIFEKKKDVKIELTTEGENSYENEENEKKNKFDINIYLNEWKENPFIFKKKITKYDNYDITQVNFKYIAGSIKDYLCLYSMETYELVTKFSVKISEDCDSVIFMIKEDILCVAWNDTISLISIKDFEVILVKIIKKHYKITEICILPDYNILIGMQNKYKNAISNHLEYFYQYKCFHNINILTKQMEYDILQVSSKLLTKNYSNITMRCLSDNRLVTVIDLELIQVWE
jgi:hypothetical protein